ncbi:MAG: hypothetical protein K2G45_06575 [Lachnospiraceae bacterium]|nr:hypothetical protein [Lachnospiraceae bacterium]
MRIEDARKTYNVQLRSYNEQKCNLAKKKQELNEKIKKTENGAEIYKDEAAVLELQYNAVSEKYDEYHAYMDKLLEQWSTELDKISGQQQAEAMEEAGQELSKILIIARRIMHGDQVPSQDEKKLMDFDEKLYQMAKSAGALAKYRDKKKHDSLWDDEEKKEKIDAMEEANNTEAFAAGPEVVSVEDTMAQAVENIDISFE